MPAVNAGNYSIAFFTDARMDDFSSVMRSLLVVIGAVAVILTLAEVGVPAAISGPVGAFIIIGGAVVQWVSATVAIIIFFITIGMFMLRRGG